MPLFDTARLMAAANGDPEFRLAARFWDAAIAIEAGAECYRLLVAGGQIAAFEVNGGSPADGLQLRLAATPEQWDQFLQPAPRPFFHDLNAAVIREGFTLAGDPVVYGPYYPALRRFWDIARELRQEAADGAL